MFETLSLQTILPEDDARRPIIRELSAEVADGVAADVRARSWQGFDSAFSRRLGAEGFIGLTLPKRYGGSERGPFARFVVVEELLGVGAPVAAHWIADRQSPPLPLNFGTVEQRHHYLPPISRSEARLL